jgi:hypothetical protein
MLRKELQALNDLDLIRLAGAVVAIMSDGPLVWDDQEMAMFL